MLRGRRAQQSRACREYLPMMKRLGEVLELLHRVVEEGMGPCALCPRDQHYVSAVARLAPGVTRAEAEAELQAAARTLAARHPELSGIDSFVLWTGPHVFVRSDAALRIAMALGWPWRALGALRVVPRRLRDAAYDFVARRRFRWFGRRESCRMPTPELRARFLD